MTKGGEKKTCLEKNYQDKYFVSTEKYKELQSKVNEYIEPKRAGNGHRITSKKNGSSLLVLGPPGMGKTWMARRIEKESERSGKFSFTIYIDPLEELQQDWEDILASTEERQRVRNNLLMHSLRKVLKKAGQSPSTTSFHQMREELREVLQSMEKIGLVIVDHITELPQDFRERLAAAWMSIIVDTGHLLILVGRTDPFLSPWIQIPKGNIIYMDKGLSLDEISELLKKRLPQAGNGELTKISKRIHKWSDGHPWTAACLSEVFEKEKYLTWKVAKTPLRELLEEGIFQIHSPVQPPNTKTLIRVLHLLSWLPKWHPTWLPELWENAKEKINFDEDWWGEGRRALLWLRHNGFLRREGVYDRLFACPVAFLTMTTASLGINEASTWREVLGDKVDPNRKLLFDELEQEETHKEEQP